MEKKRSIGVTVFGWILIVYFLYSFLYPIIATVILATAELSGIREPSSAGPIGSFSLLKHLGVSVVLLYFYSIASFVVAMIVPICSLIGGILVLKLKEGGRKFVVVAFSADFTLRLVLLFIGLINMHIRNMYMTDLSKMVLFCVFALFDVLIIYFFMRPKIKEQFLLSGS